MLRYYRRNFGLNKALERISISIDTNKAFYEINKILTDENFKHNHLFVNNILLLDEIKDVLTIVYNEEYDFKLDYMDAEEIITYIIGKVDYFGKYIYICDYLFKI
jgi:hypothetical protein